MPAPLKRGETSPKMQEALRLIANKVSWRAAVKQAGVSKSGLALAIKREKEKVNEPTPN
jgi:predicted DNA-binding protein (UPF0251 family)